MKNYLAFRGTSRCNMLLDGHSHAADLCYFASNASLTIVQIIRYFADNIRDEYANGALDGQVEGVLDEMKELSIFGP